MQEFATAILIGLATTVILWRLACYSRPPCARDVELLIRANKARNSRLDQFFLTASSIGSIYFLSPISLPILWLLMQSGRVAHACLLALSLNGACIIANIAKRKINRRRPILFPAIGKKLEDPSFPSAHSAQILTFIVSMLTLLPEAPLTSWYCLLLFGIGFGAIMLVAFSRIYLQYHYPSDVVAGLILGAGWILAVLPLLKISGIRVQ